MRLHDIHFLHAHPSQASLLLLRLHSSEGPIGGLRPGSRTETRLRKLAEVVVAKDVFLETLR